MGYCTSGPFLPSLPPRHPCCTSCMRPRRLVPSGSMMPTGDEGAAVVEQSRPPRSSIHPQAGPVSTHAHVDAHWCGPGLSTGIHTYLLTYIPERVADAAMGQTVLGGRWDRSSSYPPGPSCSAPSPTLNTLSRPHACPSPPSTLAPSR